MGYYGIPPLGTQVYSTTHHLAYPSRLGYPKPAGTPCMTIHTRVTKLKRGILQYISLEVQSSSHTIAREERDYVPLRPPKTNVQHQNNFVKIVNCECDKM